MVVDHQENTGRVSYASLLTRVMAPYRDENSSCFCFHLTTYFNYKISLNNWI